MTSASATTRTADALGAHRLTADERRAEIVEAAVTAFARGGFDGASTDDIARIAGVSQPYLFRLFGTKRELFLAAGRPGFRPIGGGPGAPGGQGAPPRARGLPPRT